MLTLPKLFRGLSHIVIEHLDVADTGTRAAFIHASRSHVLVFVGL